MAMANHKIKESLAKDKLSAIVFAILGALLMGIALGVGTHSWIAGISGTLGSILCVSAVNCYLDVKFARLSLTK